MFNLQPGSTNGLGVDAIDEDGRKYELKTTTRADGKMSTARNTGPNHLAKWRDGMHWICSKGTYAGESFIVGDTYHLSPAQMEPWYDAVESKLAQHDPLINRVLALVNTSAFADTEMIEL